MFCQTLANLTNGNVITEMAHVKGEITFALPDTLRRWQAHFSWLRTFIDEPWQCYCQVDTLFRPLDIPRSRTSTKRLTVTTLPCTWAPCLWSWWWDLRLDLCLVAPSSKFGSSLIDMKVTLLQMILGWPWKRLELLDESRSSMIWFLSRPNHFCGLWQ